MSYGWENKDEDENATDAVARGGSLIRDKVLKEIQSKDRQIKLLKHKLADSDSLVIELAAKNKLISELEAKLKPTHRKLVQFKDY